MNRLRHPGFLSCFILFLVFYAGIYFYFEKTQTRTIYGDDLYMHQEQAGYTHISDILAAGKIAYKFRPVYGIVSYAEVHLFNRSLEAFYLFNVGMQALIAVVFTVIVNLFLRSLLLSALVGLLAGLSRFAYYNIIQLMCGGPLEALAMLLFLAALYNIVVYLMYDSDIHKRRQFHYLLMAILFINLSIYAHERYLVMFPVIILFSLIHPFKNRLLLKQKLTIFFLCAGSVFANFALKEYVYHYKFLLGTGTSSLVTDFNITKQLDFLKDACASIIQFNSGAGYMIGVGFNNTSDLHRTLIIAVSVLLCILIGWYIATNKRPQDESIARSGSSGKLILCLMIIFLATLAPAISTLNLEQRWLQAPFCTFVLIIIIAFVNIRTNNKRLKHGLLIVFVIVFSVSDYIYKTGLDKFFWMKGSEWVASCYKDVIEKGFIKKEINIIYFLEPKKDQTREIQTDWLLSGGDFFGFYQGKKKGVGFLDSTMFTDPAQLKRMINFDKNTELIVKFTDNLFIVTDDVLKEREKYFKEHGITAKNN